MMGDKKRFPSRYDFSDSDTSDDEITPPSIAVKSPAKHIAPESSNMSMSRKKRKATQANYLGLSPKMIWSESDELSILKGIVDYRNETGMDYISDSGAFFDYLKDEVQAGTNGEPSGSGKDDSCDVKFPYEKVDKCVENEAGEKESEEDEALTNGNPEENDDDKLPSDNVDKHMDNETGGKGNEEDGAEDEVCALKDALETTMFQHSSRYAEKMMLQKLRTLGSKERKELSDEWKALLVQELQLKSKKQSFAGKLANAALE
ncbi:unnamed protein product [Arabis nemorensis]|uniref:Glabrous enhancer-binding protein-like DBD domain-containing protein n=1 Tax=Arabis nemorensis TaxID=586526 RepID=A0A565B599_9BRAS|nr:unnamed protein product [Arabis nemorensis]